MAAALTAAMLLTIGVWSRPVQVTNPARAGAVSQRSRPIESLRVGDRVLTATASSERAGSRVDVSTWRRLQLRAESTWEDGTIDVIHVDTLQPSEWVAEHAARVGAEVPLPIDLLEMGLDESLRATVVANDSCPPLKDGPGRVVLTTVNHLNRDVVELEVRDEIGRTQRIQPTGLHKFFSRSRGQWVDAAKLAIGESLEGVAGPVSVVGIQPLVGTHRVYNMTVEDEHVYRVSTLGVLVHNNGCADQQPPPVSGPIYRQGGSSPSNLTPRPQDNGNLSFRNSLSNPINPGVPGPPDGRPPVFGPGKDYIAVDPGRLPPGTVVNDGYPYGPQPPGHVSVAGVSPPDLKGAVIPKPSPPYGPGASGKFPQ